MQKCQAKRRQPGSRVVLWGYRGVLLFAWTLMWPAALLAADSATITEIDRGACWVDVKKQPIPVASFNEETTFRIDTRPDSTEGLSVGHLHKALTEELERLGLKRYPASAYSLFLRCGAAGHQLAVNLYEGERPLCVYARVVKDHWQLTGVFENAAPEPEKYCQGAAPLVSEKASAASKPLPVTPGEHVLLARGRYPGFKPSVEEVKACLRRNRPKENVIERVRFVHYDADDGEERCDAKSAAQWGDGERVKGKLIYRKPPDMRGIEFLGHERDPCWDAWLYLPEERNRRRLACSNGGRQPVYCTNMTMEDFKINWDSERPGRNERLEDGQEQGRPVYVLETYPPPEANSEYDKFVSWIDKETCVVMREDSFVMGEPAKRMTIELDSLAEVNGVWVARQSRVVDLDGNTRTDLSIGEIEIDGVIHPKVFDERNMGSSAGDL